MFDIKNREGVLKFVVFANILALAITLSIKFLLVPADVFRETLFSTIIIVPCVTLPIAYLGGSKLIQVSELNKKLNFLLDHDGMTSALTRDYFLRYFAEAAHPTTGVTLMIDIDDFKAVNDTHGHYVGDDVIREVALRLRSACRDNDMVSRFGGEEFALFLAGVDRASGLEIAERIRQDISARPVTSHGNTIAVTVSIGVAEKPENQHIDDVLVRADKALYSAKNAGRNQVSYLDVAPLLPVPSLTAAAPASGIGDASL